jgi:L-iditol 2-dehydrogenase
MRAVTVTRSGMPSLQEIPTPVAPVGGVLVDVRLCGLCGSDVERLRPGGVTDGQVLGHELVGVVREGPVPAGTRVALAHHVPCGRCEACRAGHEPLCETHRASHLEPGGFCERTAASAAHVAHALLPLPDGVSDLAGTFVEPLACVLRGLDRVGPVDRLLVVGAGSVGLLAAQAARARGVEATVLEPDPARQQRAALLGFQPPARPANAALVTAAPGLGDAVTHVADGGTVIVFAGGEPVSLDVDAVYRRELRLEGVRSATPAHLRAALALLATGAVEPEPLVDVVLPLEEFAEGVRRYRAREVLKVVFAP